jgi:Tripartite tricarboxylate transporter TctB family
VSSRSFRRGSADAIFCASVLLVSLIFLVQAWKLPASRFDPLGPGSFPIAICILLALLSACGLGLSLAGRSLGEAETSMILGVSDEGGARRRPWLAVFVFLAVVAYAAALQWDLIGFFFATTIFVSCAGFAMSRRTRRAAAVALAVALGISATLTLVFGKLLGLPLP